MRIADCYERNIGAHVVRAAVQDVGPATLPPVDWFHASPVCKNASVAKRDAGEQDVDMITAQATADYIAEHRPRFVTIENVWGYRKFEAWNLIAKTLTAQGYAFRVDHINMADYGVPQTRKRMWVTAVLNGNRPGLLPPTHEQDPRPSLFGPGLPRWVSWYEAIEDLIPSLPDSEFAPWQLERLPEEYKALIDVEVDRVPVSFAVSSSDLRSLIRDETRPSATVVTNNTGGTSPRAFIANGTPNDHGATMTVNGQDDPIFTQTASSWRRPPRAFIATVQGEASSYLEDGSPSQAITTGHGSGKYRAFIHGRVVKLTPRAIARLQTFPDHCALPDNDRDAVTMLGNGVPCEFVRLNGVRFMEMAND